MKGRGTSGLSDFSVGCPGNSPSCQENWERGAPGGQGHALAIVTFACDGKRMQIHKRAGAEGKVEKRQMTVTFLKLECAPEITRGSVKIWLLIRQLWVGPELLHS